MTSRAHPIPSLAAALARRSPAAAIVDCASGYTLTYAQLADAVDGLAERVIASGVAPGSTVVIACRTSVVATIGMLAAWQAGIVPVPLAELPAQAEQVRIFAQCQTGMLLCDAPSAAEIAVPGTACGEWTVPDGSLSIALLRYGGGGPAHPAERDILTLVVYTSGTTGVAKGVMLGAGAMAFAVGSMAEVVAALPGDRALVPLSGSHLYGIVANCYLLATGATVYSSDPQAPGAYLITQIVRHRLDAVLFQPQHVKRVLDAVSDAAYPTVRYVACGSGGVSMPEARRLAQCFPAARQFFYYALSEAPRAVYVADAHHSPAAEIPLGHPAAGMRLQLEGADSTQGSRIGEIIIGGPAVAMGYIGDAITSQEQFAGDTFRTGDFGEEIAGEIFYRGRAADLIAWNGLRLSPWETELRLAGELGRRAAVVGLGPAGPAGEAILRVIVEGSLTPADQRRTEAIAAPLATRFGLALRIETLPSLPRNATGKVLRQQVLDAPGN